jgi:hypothetical protein
MNIKLTFDRFEVGDSYKAELVLGDYKLRAIKDSNLPFMHPFPYMASAFLPEDKRERMAIYKFVTENSQRIKEEFGLVFEFKVKGSNLKGYEEDCRILGVPINADSNEIKKRFRELSKKWHPDMWQNGTEKDREHASEKFKEIYKAYETLSGVPIEMAVDVNVTDLNAKRLYELYDSKVEEDKINRMASLRF